MFHYILHLCLTICDIIILPVLLRPLLADIHKNRWTISSEYAYEKGKFHIKY